MNAIQRRRLASLAIVALLHVAVIAALLTLSHQKTNIAGAMPRETILWFPSPRPEAATQKPAETKPSAAAATPQYRLPDYRGITLPRDAPTVPPSLGGLHGSLFGCADLDRLTPEERAHCGGALMTPDDSVDFRDHVDRSRLAALWERGRLRKNGPLLLPCMDPHAPPGISLATVACLAKGAIEGFDPDTQPSYADAPDIKHLPNNGDPPDHPSGF